MFGSPEYLLLLPLLLLFLFRRGRKDPATVRVPSLLPWPTAAIRPRRYTVFRSLGPTQILKLLGGLLILLAAAKLRTGTTQTAVAVIVDNSPSMRNPAGASVMRLGQSTRQATRVIRALPDSDRVSVVIGGDWPRALALAKDPTEAADLLNQWTLEHDPLSPAYAMKTAADWLQLQEHLEKRLLYFGDRAMERWPPMPSGIRAEAFLVPDERNPDNKPPPKTSKAEPIRISIVGDLHIEILERTIFGMQGFVDSSQTDSGLLIVCGDGVQLLESRPRLRFHDCPAISEEAAPAAVSFWKSGHPLLEDMDINVLHSARPCGDVDHPSYDTLIGAAGQPLVAVKEHAPRAVEVLFDPVSSGFTDTPDFPIFIHNCLHWLAGTDGSSQRWHGHREHLDLVAGASVSPFEEGSISTRWPSWLMMPRWSLLGILGAVLLLIADARGREG